MSSRHAEHVSGIQELGKSLQGGDFIESPFDIPAEEERRGDPDQVDDDQNFADSEAACVAIQKSLPEGKKDIESVSFTPRLTYFLDGSLRTKYLGEYIEGERSFPILATEVSCAVVKRNGKALQTQELRTRLAFVFPHKESGLVSDSLFEKLSSLNEAWKAANSTLAIEFLKKDSKGIRDVRYSMQGKARDIMHTLEHEVANRLDLRTSWLVMDGAIRKEEFLSLSNTIGLAKSFSRKPTFDIGDGRRRSITKYLATIREGERSAVFKTALGQKVCFWYVRLRTYPPMEPLGGLVKIDFKFEPDELTQEVEKLVDEISAEIYASRAPSVYPYPRWPSFIYPIRMAEQVMRTAFINDELVGFYGNLLGRRVKEIALT